MFFKLFVWKRSEVKEEDIDVAVIRRRVYVYIY